MQSVLLSDAISVVVWCKISVVVWCSVCVYVIVCVKCSLCLCLMQSVFLSDAVFGSDAVSVCVCSLLLCLMQSVFMSDAVYVCVWCSLCLSDAVWLVYTAVLERPRDCIQGYKNIYLPVTLLCAQFSSRWYLCAQKSPCALHRVSQTFPQRCLWNGSNVRLTDDGPLSSFQGRSSSASSFHASLLQAINGVMSLALCPQVVSQAPQHFRSSGIHSSFSLNSRMKTFYSFVQLLLSRCSSMTRLSENGSQAVCSE